MTYTHLTVGQSKIPAKPPRAQPPCTEPIVYGANILNDPGVELWQSWHGRTEIPHHTTAWHIDLKYDDSTPAVSPYGFANHDSSTSLYGYWRVDTTDMRTGSACLEYVPGSNAAGNPLYLASFNTCGALTRDRYPVARVEPGDYTAFSCWVKASATTNSPYIRAIIEWNDSDGTAIDSAFMTAPYHLLSTSYTQMPLLSGFVPAGAVYVIVRFHIEATSSTLPGSYFVDDLVLEVS